MPENNDNQQNQNDNANNNNSDSNNDQDRNWEALRTKANKERLNSAKMAAKLAGFDVEKKVTLRMLNDLVSNDDIEAITDDVVKTYAKDEWDLTPTPPPTSTNQPNNNTPNQDTNVTDDSLTALHGSANPNNSDTEPGSDALEQYTQLWKAGKIQEAFDLKVLAIHGNPGQGQHPLIEDSVFRDHKYTF